MKVLLVDDDIQIRESIKESLELAGLDVVAFASTKAALEVVNPLFSGVIVSDVRMPEMDGLEFLRKVSKIDADLPFILITGHGHVSMAVRAMRSGAYDFIEKPFRPETLITVVKRAMDKRQLTLDNCKLRNQLDHALNLEKKIIGSGASMMDLRDKLKRYAEADVDVLIHGESGTGKELIARSLHELGPRRNQPFVAINCSAISTSLSGSELFGHVQGAFLGAKNERIGKFEYADQGVVFLDEVEGMPLELQAELLRVLQERSIVKLGDNTEIPLNIRVLSATKSSLQAASEKGDFRADLYFRLDVVNLHIPPLRERMEDVPLLFQHFVNQHTQDSEEPVRSITPGLYDQLLSYEWPGNVRELQNNARRFAMGFEPEIGGNTTLLEQEPESLSVRVNRYEVQIIKQTIEQFDGNVSKAAEFLQVSRRTLYNKL